MAIYMKDTMMVLPRANLFHKIKKVACSTYSSVSKQSMSVQLLKNEPVDSVLVLLVVISSLEGESPLSVSQIQGRHYGIGHLHKGHHDGPPHGEYVLQNQEGNLFYILQCFKTSCWKKP